MINGDSGFPVFSDAPRGASIGGGRAAQRAGFCHEVTAHLAKLSISALLFCLLVKTREPALGVLYSSVPEFFYFASILS